MRIKEIRCEQFAGLHDRDVDFEKGLNIIIGENESGKSTLVDLIYHLFFQSETVDGRRDKDFKERYFPSTTGDRKPTIIDGVIKFETDNGTYKLKKEWSAKSGTNGYCKLTLPDGTVINDGKEINAILAEELKYGKGVYDELIFASQRREQTILESILGEKVSESMDSLSTTLTQAVMETGGVAIDEMEKELSDTISSYEGHWDFEHDMPVGGVKRGIQNKWEKSVGRILSAYYAKMDAAALQEDAEQAELEVERINASIRSKKEELKIIQDKRDKLGKVRSQISERKLNQQLLLAADKEWGEMKTALEDWPSKSSMLTRAEELKARLQKSQLKEQYRTVKELADSIAEAQAVLDSLGKIEDVEVKEAVSLEKQITGLEAQLKGMKLSLRIKRLGDADVHVKSAITGKSIGESLETVAISEAVDILIPDVAEIGIAPEGVDVNQICSDLTIQNARLSEILEKYSVKSVEELQEKQKKASERVEFIDKLREKMSIRLDKMTWEDLIDAASAIPDDIGDSSLIHADLKELCGSSPDAFIGGLSSDIARYRDAYESIEKLAESEKKKCAEVNNLKDDAENMEAIPDEFDEIEDPEAFDKELKDEAQKIDKELDALYAEHSDAVRNLGERSAEDYSDEFQMAEGEFQNTKAEYARWKHIQTVFLKIKESAKGNPMGDVERNFREYLSLLTAGAISLNTINEDLESSITSGNNRLTSNILSDGTKDAITLAFRLAVLDHLYPDGGCVVVFDDPFTDMDPKRTAQACAMIQKFAEKNQVIFVTCDTKYQKLLQGEFIQITK